MHQLLVDQARRITGPGGEGKPSFKFAFSSDCTDSASRTKLEENYRRTKEGIVDQLVSNENSGNKTGHQQILVSLIY